MKQHCLSLTLFIALLGSVAHAAQVPDFGNLFSDRRPPTQVNAKLWRSGRPTPETLTYLYQQGVRTILDLEDDDAAVGNESQWAKTMGFTFISVRTSALLPPTDESIDHVLALLKASRVPVLVHCQHGEDRTGLVIGLERVFNESWTTERAYAEMLDNGYHPILVGLDGYFRAKTLSASPL